MSLQFICKDRKHNHFRAAEVFGTYVGFIPVIDGEGHQLTPDPNYYSTQYTCQVCNKTYTKIKKGWITRFFEGVHSYMDFDNGSHFFEIDETPPHALKLNT